MVWNAEILGICVWTTQATSLAPGSCVQRVRVCRGSTLSVEGKGFHKWPSDLSTRWPRVYPEDQSWSFPWFVLLAIKNAYISQSLEGQNRVRNPSWNVVTVLLIGDLWLLVSTRAELRNLDRDETIWPEKPKIFTLWPFYTEICLSSGTSPWTSTKEGSLIFVVGKKP